MTDCQRQEEAAWELLYAVRELFPQKLAELELIGRDLSDDHLYRDEDPEEYPPGTLPETFQKRVWEWTERNRISCNAVNVVASRFVAGEDGVPEGRLTEVFEAKKGDPVDTMPSIHANPFDETPDEFMARARVHYKEVCALLRKHGYKKGLIKRERDHFRYLVAHLVGGLSWPEITRQHARLKVPTSRSPKTVVGEARKLARQLGISLPPGTPGRPRRQQQRRQ